QVERFERLPVDPLLGAGGIRESRAMHELARCGVLPATGVREAGELAPRCFLEPAPRLVDVARKIVGRAARHVDMLLAVHGDFDQLRIESRDLLEAKALRLWH